VAIEFSEILLREAHPSAALSFFFAPLRSSGPFLVADLPRRFSAFDRATTHGEKCARKDATKSPLGRNVSYEILIGDIP